MLEIGKPNAMMCDGWNEQSEGLNMTQMSDMVIFFTCLLEEKGVRRVCPDDWLCRRFQATDRKLLE